MTHVSPHVINIPIKPECFHHPGKFSWFFPTHPQSPIFPTQGKHHRSDSNPLDECWCPTFKKSKRIYAVLPAAPKCLFAEFSSLLDHKYCLRFVLGPVGSLPGSRSQPQHRPTQAGRDSRFWATKANHDPHRGDRRLLFLKNEALFSKTSAFLEPLSVSEHSFTTAACFCGWKWPSAAKEHVHCLPAWKAFPRFNNLPAAVGAVGATPFTSSFDLPRHVVLKISFFKMSREKNYTTHIIFRFLETL